MEQAGQPSPHSAAGPPRRGLSRLVLFALLSVFAVIGLASLIVFAFSAGAFFNRQPVTRLTTGATTIDQVRSLKLLTVLSYDVTTDAESEHAERKGLWLARGSADYVVDFSKAQVLDADESTKVIRLKLPRPFVRSAKLDPVRTRLLTYEKTGWGWWTLGALGSRDDFEQQSRVMLQKKIEQAAGEAALLDSAKGSAVQLMSSLYAPVKWTVHVEWDDNAAP
jgi:hypothetical protein